MVTLNAQLSDAIDYFTTGPKRETLLTYLSKELLDNNHLKKVLIKLSMTRWTQRDRSWSSVVKAYPYMVQALEIISGEQEFSEYEVDFDVNSRGRANTILHFFKSPLFLVGKFKKQILIFYFTHNFPFIPNWYVLNLITSTLFFPNKNLKL